MKTDRSGILAASRVNRVCKFSTSRCQEHKTRTSLREPRWGDNTPTRDLEACIRYPRGNKRQLFFLFSGVGKNGATTASADREGG